MTNPFDTIGSQLEKPTSRLSRAMDRWGYYVLVTAIAYFFGHGMYYWINQIGGTYVY